MKDADTLNNSKTGEYKPVNGTTYYANTGITKGSAYAQEAVSIYSPHPSLRPLHPNTLVTELRKQQHHHHKHLLQHLHPDFPSHHRLRSLPLAILPLPKHR